MSEALAGLATERVTVRFGGVCAVDDVTFAANQGEVVGLIGPNGAGKSTLLNCLSGVARPSAGRVLMAGHDVTRWSVPRRARHGLGRTFQHIRLFPSLSVGRNIEVAVTASWPLALAGGLAQRRGDAQGTASDLAHHSLAVLGIDHLYDSDPSQLPPGQRRLVEIARLLAMGTRILLLDEPSSGLNVTEAARLYALIESLKAEDRTIVVVEHRLKTITGVADRLVVLDRGRVIAAGPTSDVIRDPVVQNAYVGEQSHA